MNFFSNGKWFCLVSIYCSLYVYGMFSIFMVNVVYVINNINFSDFSKWYFYVSGCNDMCICNVIYCIMRFMRVVDYYFNFFIIM